MKVAEIVNEKILALIAAGTIPWQQPWRFSHRSNANLVSKKPYRGINQVLLNAETLGTTWWVTYRQALALGGNVRKGEKGTMVVFWKFFKTEEGIETRPPMLRYYTIFNVSQCDGIDCKIPPPPEPEDHVPIDECVKITEGYVNKPEIVYGADVASYSPVIDRVQMPELGYFKSAEFFHSVLFHELVHSTGHKSRLDRNTITKSGYGTESYSREELTAELGSCYLCAAAGINPQYEDSANYIESWSKHLKNDPMAFMTAASHASGAADYILGIKEDKDGESESEGEEA